MGWHTSFSAAAGVAVVGGWGGAGGGGVRSGGGGGAGGGGGGVGAGVVNACCYYSDFVIVIFSFIGLVPAACMTVVAAEVAVWATAVESISSSSRPISHLLRGSPSVRSCCVCQFPLLLL